MDTHRFFKLPALLLLGCVMSALLSCTKRQSNAGDSESGDSSFIHVGISLEPDFYDSVVGDSPRPEVIVLKEDENTMFAEIDRVIDANGKYYILNEMCTVVSFTHGGEPFARYGQLGQGPGEYVFPRDINVVGNHVYVLDLNLRKIITYEDDGTFVSEWEVPFNADAFRIMDNGDVLLNLTPMGDSSPGLCLSDSTFNDCSTFLPYSGGYVSGMHTADIFRTTKSGQLTFYKSPSDTLRFIDATGKPDGGIVFDFKEKALPQEAKKDFVKAFHEGIDGKLWLVNSPMNVGDDLWLGFVEDGKTQYTMLFSIKDNKCGGREFSEKSSVFDIIEPRALDEHGNVISVIDAELASMCRDYDALGDSIKALLEDGNRALLVHKLHNPHE